MPKRVVRFLIILLVIFILIFIGDRFSLDDSYGRAKILLENRQYKQAIPLFKRNIKRSNCIADYALYYLAEAYWQNKDLDNAELYFNRLLQEYPGNKFREKAEFRSVQIKLAKGQVLTLKQKFQEAIGIYNERDYGPAGVKFKNIIRYYPGFKQKGEAYHYLGLCRYFLRQYRSAIKSFNLAIRYGSKYYVKSLWWSARSYRKIRWYKSALFRYQAIYNKYPKNALAPKALVAAAEVQADRKLYKSSNYLFSRLRKGYPQHYLAGESYWKEGWNFYIKRNYRQAARLFGRGADNLPNNIYSAALSFWAGKANKRTGRKTTAAKYYQKAFENYDHNYYAYRSAQELGEQMPYIPKGRMKKIRSKAKRGKRYAVLLKQKAFRDAWLEVKTAISTANKTLKARTYLELAEVARLRGYLLEHLEFLEKFLRLKLIPASELPLVFWHKYYPRPFYKYIKDAARKYKIDKDLVLGLIREESKFQTEIISQAGARGLMQLMPNTAGDLLKTKQLEIGILHDPRVNVQLGTAYFARLLQRYKGNKVLALAAYNAGPHRVKSWLKQYPLKDQDEWIENIPFVETRNYVKRVLRSYWEYQRIYK